MPAFVKTARDERLWKEARAQAGERFPEGSHSYWAYANRVFHRMKYRIGGGEYPVRRNSVRLPGENPERIPGGLAEGMHPWQFDQDALRKGTEVEMEHTGSRLVAQEIGMDHLVEDPQYYDKLETIENPGQPPSKKVRDAYLRFHGVEPESVTEGTLWVPGPMIYLGPCLDIGYRPPKGSKKGQFHYVHDHDAGVKVYCRPNAARVKAEPSLHYRTFPSEIWALGANIGFTYHDRFDNQDYEVAGSNSKKLCTDASGKKLYVVDREGVLFMVKGGKMKVTDWIRN